MPELHGDEAYYVTAGRALAQGEGYPGSARPPGFPLFVAATVRVLGGSLTALRIAQVPVSLLAVAAVFDLARRRFGLPAALGSGLICAIHPTLVHYTHFLWSETLFTTLLVVAFWLLDRFDRTHRGVWLLGAGAVLAAAALTRELVIYFLPVVGLWLVKGSPPRRRMRLGLLLTPLVVLVLPWTLRNYSLHHRFVLVSTTRWFPMAVGNLLAGESTALGKGRTREFHHRYREIPGELAREAFARETALRAIAEQQPLWIVRKALLNTYWLFTTRSQLSRFVQSGWIAPEAMPFARKMVAIETVFYALTMSLGLAALALVPGGRLKWLVVAMLLLFLGLYIVANSNHRFRVPLLPFFALYSGPLLAGCMARDARRRSRTMLAGALLLAFLAVLIADIRYDAGLPGDLVGAAMSLPSGEART